MGVGHGRSFENRRSGFTHVLVAVDKFTKWIEAKPIKNLDAGTAVSFIRELIFRYGVPHNIITKAPTAELRENQKDQDTLPPYDMLDEILGRLVEGEESIASIVETTGYDREVVIKVERMLNIAEYKRRQAAPGVKVTLKNFGRDRRYPIVNRFRDTGAPLPQPDSSLLRNGAAAKSSAVDV